MKVGWVAFGKVNNIMKSRNASMKAKKKILHEYVLPMMTYGNETWALNKAIEEMVVVAQIEMECIMLGILHKD